MFKQNSSKQNATQFSAVVPMCRNIDESIKNICDFTVETIIESASTCLRAIDPSLKVPAKLPSVFMFLIENLPTEGKKTTAVATTPKNKSLLMQDISNKIGDELKSIWIPPCCKPTSQNIGDFEVS
ncbi:putative coiled-coil domain containing 22, partial [Operophtera brumata]